MRCLERNKRTVWYANYASKTELKDEYNNFTGQYEITYSNPVKLMCNVSAAKGTDEAAQFGTDLDYDRTITVMEVPQGFTENSIMWVDSEPVISSSGSTTTPNDCIVKKIGSSVNGVSIAIKKVKVGV